MRSLREALATILVVLLALGYAGSQWAYFAGQPEAWAAKIDVPQVKNLALAIVAAILVLGLWPDREDRG